MEYYCSVADCTAANVHYFEFPTDFDKCMLWVQSCKRTDLKSDFLYEGAKALINRFICSEHFSIDDLCDPQCLNKGLKPSAVPKTSIVSACIYEEHPNQDDYVLFTNNHGLDNTENAFNKINESQIKQEKELPVNLQSNSGSGAYVGIFIKEELFDTTEGLTTDAKHLQELELRSKRLSIRRSVDAQRKAIQRANETREQRQKRLHKDALRAAYRRKMETPQKKLERRQRDAERVAYRRTIEPGDQKELRRLKDRLRVANRRKNETIEQAKYRRYVNAVAHAFRRLQETHKRVQCANDFRPKET